MKTTKAHHRRMSTYALAAVLAAGGTFAGVAHAQQFVEIFPPHPHQANNTVPFRVGSGGITMHQVFASFLFSNVSAGQPVTIERITFTGQVSGHMILSLGYTNAIPSSTLLTPDPAGGGAPNAAGPMHVFFDDNITDHGTTSTAFDMVYDGPPFVYDPSLGNLLLEVHMPTRFNGSSSSRGISGTNEASRTYQVHGGNSGGSNQASRIEFTFSIGGAPSCYADCNGDDLLNIADFLCFIDEFAQAQTLPPAQQQSHYANCTGATSEPFLTVADFLCFIDEFAQGCP